MTDAHDDRTTPIDHLTDVSPPDHSTAIFDPVFEALATPTARYIIYVLLERETATFDEVVTQVAAWASEHDRLDEHDSTRWVATTIFHVHLPNLVEAGLVAVDAEERLTLTGPADSVRRLLRACRRCELDEG